MLIAHVVLSLTFWYLPFEAHLIAVLDTRLLAGSDRYKAQYLLQRKLHALNNNAADEVYDNFK